MNPVGHHSPGLMRILNSMRYDQSGYQTILVTLKPFSEWVLGVMPPNRADEIVLDHSRIFYNREEAEWFVFCRRWEKHTGEKLNTPLHTTEDRAGDI